MISDLNPSLSNDPATAALEGSGHFAQRRARVRQPAMVTISETLSDTYCHLLLDAIFKTWENFQCAHQAELSMHASD